MEIKKYLKERRLQLGLTIKQIADAVGVNEATVSRWESGKINSMRRDKIYALSKVLDIDPMIIIGRENEENRIPTEEEMKIEKIKQDMYESPSMRTVFNIKKNMPPEEFEKWIQMLQIMRGEPNE